MGYFFLLHTVCLDEVHKKKLCFLECPEFNGGSAVTQYEVNLINPEGNSRIVYTGFDTECLVASLLPGRSYSFQVRANNKIGVTMEFVSLL